MLVSTTCKIQRKEDMIHSNKAQCEHPVEELSSNRASELLQKPSIKCYHGEEEEATKNWRVAAMCTLSQSEIAEIVLTTVLWIT